MRESRGRENPRVYKGQARAGVGGVGVGLHFVCCPRRSACLSSVAASLDQGKSCPSVGKLEVRAGAAVGAMGGIENRAVKNTHIPQKYWWQDLI